MAQNSKGAYLNVLQDADGKDVYPITRADGVYMNDGTTAQAKCEALDSKIDSTKSSLDASIATKLASAKSSLQSSFQAGVDGIYDAITAQGTTPASKSQGDVKNAIGTLATNKYDQGKNDVSLSVAGSYVNASNGKSARVDYKGQYYRNEGNNVGLAGDYFHATFPEGYYGSEGQDWAPEIRVPVGTMNANGWYDQDQYNSHYDSGYNAGYSAGKSVTVAKLSAIKISANRGVAPKGDGAQGAGASGVFTIDTSNYSSAWLGAVEIYKMRSYVDATMTIKSNSGSVLFSLSTSGDGKKTGGNVTLNLSGVSSITITINPAIYDNALNSSDSYGYISSLSFAA